VPWAGGRVSQPGCACCCSPWPRCSPSGAGRGRCSPAAAQPRQRHRTTARPCCRGPGARRRVFTVRRRLLTVLRRLLTVLRRVLTVLRRVLTSTGQAAAVPRRRVPRPAHAQPARAPQRLARGGVRRHGPRALRRAASAGLHGHAAGERAPHPTPHPPPPSLHTSGSAAPASRTTSKRPSRSFECLSGPQRAGCGSQ
jgi:hypothetical protein